MPRQMPRKGLKITKGQPERYEEVKKPLNLALTPTGAKMLDELAAQIGLTRSELVERIARRSIPLHPDALGDEEKKSLGKDLGNLSLCTRMN